MSKSFLVSLGVGPIVRGDISLGIGGRTRDIAQGLLYAPKVDINGIIDFGNASRQTHCREESGKSFLFATFGNIHFSLFSFDF